MARFVSHFWNKMKLTLGGCECTSSRHLPFSVYILSLSFSLLPFFPLSLSLSYSLRFFVIFSPFTAPSLLFLLSLYFFFSPLTFCAPSILSWLPFLSFPCTLLAQIPTAVTLTPFRPTLWYSNLHTIPSGIQALFVVPCCQAESVTAAVLPHWGSGMGAVDACIWHPRRQRQ